MSSKSKKNTGDLTDEVVENSANCEARSESSAEYINWRDRIKPEFVVLNKERKDKVEKAFGKPIEEIPFDKISDDDKLIRLAGFKDVAKQKGYSSIDYQIVTDTRDYVTMKCVITWNDGCTTVGCGNAHEGNVEPFWQNLLVTCAENRAFVRCVRNHLGIYIIGQDEMGADNKPVSPRSVGASPMELLILRVKERGKTFEQFVEWYAKHKPEAVKWRSYSDIPTSDLYEILLKLKGSQ